MYPAMKQAAGDHPATIQYTDPVDGQRKLKTFYLPEKSLPPAGSPQRAQTLGRFMMQKKMELENPKPLTQPGLGAGGGSGNSGGGAGPKTPAQPGLGPTSRGSGASSGGAAGGATGNSLFRDAADVLRSRMKQQRDIHTRARQLDQADKFPWTKPEEWQPDPVTGRLKHIHTGTSRPPEAPIIAPPPAKIGGSKPPVLPSAGGAKDPATQHLNAAWRDFYSKHPAAPDDPKHPRASVGLAGKKSWEPPVSPVAAGLARVVAQLAGERE